MEGNAECKVCNDGVLLPFTSPEGHVVYCCTNCMSMFSAYNEEPQMDGVPVFSPLAYYVRGEDLESEETFTTGELMDEFKKILKEISPQPSETSECDYCSEPLCSNGRCQDLCFLPEV